MKRLYYYMITKAEYENGEWRPLDVTTDYFETENDWTYGDIVENQSDGIEILKKEMVQDLKDIRIWRTWKSYFWEEWKEDMDCEYLVEIKPEKTYKNFEKYDIGDSDIASLILAGYVDGVGLQLTELPFGGDGSYSAYITNASHEGDVAIGSHYEKIAEFDTWLKIYDDDMKTVDIDAEKIIVHRAKEMGCIIECVNCSKAHITLCGDITNELYRAKI